MPYYKSPQQLNGTGPSIEFSPSRPYWIDAYLVPPIDEGQPISLTVLSNREGATAVMLAYYDFSLQSIVGPALVNVIFAPNQKGLVIYTKADRSGPYLLSITSYNSSYSFHLTSVWSPFYGLKSLVIYAFGLLPTGLIMVYYDGIVEQRQRMEEKALKGIRAGRLRVLPVSDISFANFCKAYDFEVYLRLHSTIMKADLFAFAFS